MALKDQIALGMSLPHRSPDPIEAAVVRQVAQRAEALGFRDLWVTNNTLDHAGCFDSLTLSPLCGYPAIRPASTSAR